MQVTATNETIEAIEATANVAAQTMPLSSKSAGDAAMAGIGTQGSMCSPVPSNAAVVAPSVKALAYLRTSSASNVGGDSDHRQRDAIDHYAAAQKIEIVEEFYDGAVSGADPVESRAGFADMLARIDASDVRLVLVEDCSRLARSVLVSELAIVLLVRRGVRVMTASGDDLTATDDPGRIVMRQVGSAFAEYEKRRLVLKLAHARAAKRAATGRCEGRKGYNNTKPELVAAAKALRASGLAQRAIAAQLAARGFVTATGKVMSAGQIGRLLQYA